VHKRITNAKDFLYMSALYWERGAEGRKLANLIASKKLDIPYKKLAAELAQGKTIEQLRDERLTKALMAKHRHMSAKQAKRLLLTMSEGQRQELVNQLINPLDVRIYLSMMAQWRYNGFSRQNRALHTIKAVGGEVLLANSPLTARPGRLLKNLWSSVSHAKLILTPNEVSLSGFNIGDHYLQPHGALKWHDVGIRVRGEVADAQLLNFTRHWNREAARSPVRVRAIDHAALVARGLTGKSEHEQERATENPRSNAVIVGSDDLANSTTPQFNERAELVYALATFKESFVTTSPYLTSPFFTRRAEAASKRRRRQGKSSGITVVDSAQGHDEWASNAGAAHHLAARLVAAGADVRHWSPSYARQQGMENRYHDDAFSHAKVTQLDKKVTKISSANKNERSLHRDWETGIVTRSVQVSKRMLEKLIQPTLDQSQSSLLFPDKWWYRATSRAKRFVFGDLALFY
jgi:phosphatidylserine/phosphatidylglycerophosphate/cardiolipin synthase-like enzyme